MCERCGKDKNTLYDLRDGFICLTCAYELHEDSQRLRTKLINSAVTGAVNIEKRLRAIAKRKRWKD